MTASRVIILSFANFDAPSDTTVPLLLPFLHDTAYLQSSHKPHHRFLNPKMFDAFNGSVADTVFMILVPLSITAQVVFACARVRVGRDVGRG